MNENGETIRRIDVEVAADDAERARGLMYRPYSEESRPSFADAQYVVEVNAGFTDRYGIEAGDRIRF